MPLPDELVRSRNISLTTFRKTGAPVPTPVGFLVDDGKLFVLTPRDSGKVKRIRATASVTVAPCDNAGRVPAGASTAEGTARLLDAAGTARVRGLMVRRFPIAWPIFAWNRLTGRGDRLVGIEVAL